jgi:hypothetical protein
MRRWASREGLTLTSDDFERQVARLIQAAEGDGAVVTWDDRLRDPDNPDQARQIGVTVKRPDSLSIIECRLHSRPQDVNWVEELYGRRASLRAQMVMGVSASGFTTGAWKKAAALGVFLRELRELTTEEANSWGRSTRVRLSYIHLRRLELYLVPTSTIHIARPHSRTLLLKSNGEPWPLDDLFRTLANRLAELNTTERFARLQVFTRELHIGSVPVPEVVLNVDWRWVHRDVSVPTVLTFRGPGEPAEPAEAMVEKNHYSRTEIFHVNGTVLPVIDVSLAPPEPRSYLRRADIDLGAPLPVRGIAMIGVGEPLLSLFRFKIKVIRKDSSLYQALLPDEGTPAWLR